MRRRDFLSGIAAAGLWPEGAEATPRPVAAFVMGCGAFDHLPDLATPVADARAIAARLVSIGHDVSLHLNPNRDALLLALARFRLRAAAADMVVFYLATHGVQQSGRVWLAPTDAAPGDGLSPPGGLVPLQAFLWAVSDRARTRVVFADACREVAALPGGPRHGRAFPAEPLPGRGFICSMPRNSVRWPLTVTGVTARLPPRCLTGWRGPA